MTGNIKIISASDGDWEALYVNGKKVLEGHSLDAKQSLEAVGLIVESVEVDADPYATDEAFPETLDSVSPESLNPEPIHAWFELSYSSYLVLPRTLLQSMPAEWQAKMVGLLDEAHQAFGCIPEAGHYTVYLRGEKGRIMHDPLADYERGRRRIEPLETASP